MTERRATRTVDTQGRVELFATFAGKRVIVERIGDDEIRIRKVRTVMRHSLVKLPEGITEENRHGGFDSGPPVGKEMI